MPAVGGVQITGGLQVLGNQRRVLVGRFGLACFDRGETLRVGFTTFISFANIDCSTLASSATGRFRSVTSNRSPFSTRRR